MGYGSELVQWEVYGRSMGGLATRPPVVKCFIDNDLRRKREVSAKNHTYLTNLTEVKRCLYNSEAGIKGK